MTGYTGQRSWETHISEAACAQEVSTSHEISCHRPLPFYITKGQYGLYLGYLTQATPLQIGFWGQQGQGGRERGQENSKSLHTSKLPAYSLLR